MQKKSPCRTSCKCGQFTGFLTRKTDRTFRWTKQRVALARCLLRDKPILLLDEPFSALDPKLRIEMQDLMDQLCEEKTHHVTGGRINLKKLNGILIE